MVESVNLLSGAIKYEREKRNTLKAANRLVRSTNKLERQRSVSERQTASLKEKERKRAEKLDKERGVTGSRFITKTLSKPLLGRPTANIPSVSPTKFISGGERVLVKPGRTGYFASEYVKEKQSWLS